VIQSLDSESFEKYSKMIFSFLEDVDGFAVCDSKGEPVWTSDESGRDGMTAAVALMNQNVTGWINSTEIVNQRKIDQNCIVHKRSLVEDVDGQIGNLVVLSHLREDIDQDIRSSSVNTTLEMIGESILNEYRLTNEINSLAEELGDRYEEINLIYETAQQVKNVSEGPRNLRQLVKNCTDYLNVDITVLLLSGKKITTFFEDAENTIPDTEKIVGNLHNLLQRTIVENQIVVINDENDPLKATVAKDLPYKLMSFPVLDSNENVKGVLVTMNHNYRPDFTTGARNILKVIARKASEIIQANTDDLTGLMNRPSIEYHLENALSVSRLQGIEHCFLSLNVDKMKLINDTTSLTFGDDLIKEIGSNVRSQVRDFDHVARLGGDELGILLEKCTAEQGQRVAEKICSQISSLSIVWNDNPIEVSASIGVVPILPDSESVQNIMVFAELACELAKEEGGNAVRLYESGNVILAKRKEEMRWVGPIQVALKENRFKVYSQAIKPLQSEQEPWHYECLLRLQDEKGRIIAPGEFMPAAERYQLMPTIDLWVIKNTLALLADYSDRGELGQRSWSINLSGQSFTDMDFLNSVLEVLKESRVPAENICFEVTETAAVTNLMSAQRFIRTLKELGYKFSLDDFGTGLSSFAYLKNMQVDYLKIDGSFVKVIIEDKSTQALVVGMNQIGHALNLKTIAEYVENEAIEERLQKIGVDFAQGYGVGKPRPLDEALAEMVEMESAQKQA